MTSPNSYNCDPRFYYYHGNTQYLNYNVQYPNYYTHEQNTQLHNFVDPTTSFTPKPLDYATGTSSITSYFVTHRKAHHIENHQLESIVSRQNVMTNDVGTTDNFEESHPEFQMQTAMYGLGQSNYNILESKNFEGIQSHEMERSSSNRPKNVTEENNNCTVIVHTSSKYGLAPRLGQCNYNVLESNDCEEIQDHKMERSSSNSPKNLQNCDDVTEENSNCEVYLADVVTNWEVQRAQNVTNVVVQQGGKESNNFEEIQYHEMQCFSDNIPKNVKNCEHVIEEKNKCEVHLVKDITNVEVQQAKDITNDEVHQIQSYSTDETNGNDASVTKKKIENAKLSCDPCGKVFKKLGYLKQHNSAVHNADKLYQCKKCNKRFCTEDECKKHYEKHYGEKPFSCKDCDKKFHYKSDLNRHSRKHTKNLFFCPTCGKGFTRRTHRELHQNSHVRKTTKHVKRFN